ncbi:MAG TPA: PHP domain-containing protein [Firmicutes bacterium]|nr:PHP domain-containing protein [Bacillota bacterium]
MMIVADLHVHTTASDGLLAPEEVVRLAVENKLQAVAVCDHDTTGGLEAALNAGGQYGISVIPGIEFSTEYREKEIHILGYGFDYTYDKLQALCWKINAGRSLRMEKMVQKLRQLGYSITGDDVLRQARGAAPNRPHVARVLVEKGYFPTVKAVFAALLEPGKPAYVRRYKLTPREAIAVLGEAGGFAVWAHPGLVGDDGLLALFLSWGLRGLEVYHPDHSHDAEEHYVRLARKHNLLITGGSDYHGTEAGSTRTLGTKGLQAGDFAAFAGELQK